MPKLKAALAVHQANANRYSQQQKAKQRAEELKKQAKLNRNGGNKKKRRDEPSKPSSLDTIENAQQDREDIPDETDRKGKKKATIPFDQSDTILLLGEANFSFATSLLSPPHDLKGYMICATSYDSKQVCFKKYPDAEANVEKLKANGVRVLFGVDAGELPKDIVGGRSKKKDAEYGQSQKSGGRWSRVVFNFPHVGAGITDQDRNILSNQHLLLRTLRSVYPILTTGPLQPPTPKSNKRKKSDIESEEEDEGVSDLEQDQPIVPANFTPPLKNGTILITLLDQPPYSLWNLPKLATRPPPTCPGTRLAQPKYKLLRSFEFDPGLYSGYAHRRTIGFKSGVSKDGNEEIVGRKGRARTWEFGRAEEGQ